VIIEPGTTVTKFQNRAIQESGAALAAGDSAYAAVYRRALMNYTTPALNATPEDVARRIVKIVGKRWPAARYRVKWYDAVAIAFTRVLPAIAIDFGVARWIGLQELRSPRG